MWMGDIPKELKGLTIPVLRLIAKYRHNSCIIKLKSGSCDLSSVQSALKGNVIIFKQLNFANGHDCSNPLLIDYRIIPDKT